MKRLTKIAIAGGVLTGALVFTGAGLAQATSTEGPDAEESEVAITGAALEQASAAALAHTGEGVVTETEVGDEESLYEVEVTLDDGSEVDVQLDEKFQVVGSESDGGTESDD